MRSFVGAFAHEQPFEWMSFFFILLYVKHSSSYGHMTDIEEKFLPSMGFKVNPNWNVCYKKEEIQWERLLSSDEILLSLYKSVAETSDFIYSKHVRYRKSSSKIFIGQRYRSAYVIFFIHFSHEWVYMSRIL